MSEIIIKQGDITNEDVDVIVNAANTRLAGGGGVDGAIHRAAGPQVMEECRKIGSCPTGEAVMTTAGRLRARNIIHTAGPVWHGGDSNEAVKLTSCYENSFRIARENGLRSIAFPAISTGIYGYPIEKATWIAIEEGLRHRQQFDRIVYVCYSRDDLKVYEKVYEQLLKAGK
ncbi:MAG: O-acetyl-ADP-ribose deacetylase [Candidatus Omnitrophica bacterium]|nr:O-acetyl-ADP-ribose deacetylase [Candidatus Omnitrophota bacterium]